MGKNSARSSGLIFVRVALAASLVLPGALFVWTGWATQQKIFALAKERISRSLDMQQEHATKSFEIGTLILDDAIEDLLSAPLAGREQYFHSLFQKRIRTVSEIQSIWLFDTEGYALVNSSAFPAPRDRNFAKEDYFRAHVNKDIGTYYGEIHKSFSGNPPYFTMSRRITRDGVFAGVLEISMMPADFYKFYTQLAYGEGLQYALIREDGTFLVRYPIPETVPPIPLGPATGFRKTIVSSREGGFYTTTSPVDNVERRFGVRRLPDTDVYVSAGVATTAMHDQWLDEMFPYLAYGIPAALFIFLTLLFAQHSIIRLNSEMSRREAAEGALRQAHRLDAIGQLTGGIAHDFNNLLTIIVGNLESAQRQLTNTTEAAVGRLGDVIGRAMQGAQRAATLTRRLLAFSRQQPLNPKPLDVNKLLIGLPDLLRGGLGESVAIEVVGAAGLWTVEADSTELETAIVNLAINARDAMPDGGKLTIEASNTHLDESYCARHPYVSPGQYVQIAVSDTGHGMSTEIINRAFEPFFTTKSAGQGTGLGLSQVYGFVKQSGGHVKIYSELGHGRTTKIYLPRRGANKVEEETPTATQSSGLGGSILLVEDDDDVRDYLTKALRELGFMVIPAANGEKALQVLDSYGNNIDLLITDVVMPGMNGRKVAEAVVARRPDMKVLYMTGYSRNAIVHHGRLDRDVALVQKPVTGAQLAAKIRSMLDPERDPPRSTN